MNLSFMVQGITATDTSGVLLHGNSSNLQLYLGTLDGWEHDTYSLIKTHPQDPLADKVFPVPFWF